MTNRGPVPAHDQRRGRGRGDREDPGGNPAGCHPLVTPGVGQARGDVGLLDPADLESVRPGPHKVEYFKISTDPLLVDKVRDVVGLYLDPPEGALVLSVDEKPQIQALERTAPVLPMVPGVPERRSHDYHRHGTTTCSPRWM